MKKWDEMKWNERFPFSPLLLKIDISELEILHNKLLNNNNRLFSLQPLSYYFIVFENMCHHLSDCGQIEVTNSHGMNSNSKWFGHY